MNTILNEIQELADTDLYALCEAIDLELQREGLIGDLPDSARRRALDELSPRRHSSAASAGRGSAHQAAARTPCRLNANRHRHNHQPELEVPWPKSTSSNPSPTTSRSSSPWKPIAGRSRRIPDDLPPQPSDDDHDPRADETYWSGRNHRRRSARWAA